MVIPHADSKTFDATVVGDAAELLSQAENGHSKRSTVHDKHSLFTVTIFAVSV